jgi:hypothetical protein
LLVPSEAERRESADDDEENGNAAHRERIGSPPDGLDSHLVAQSRELPWATAATTRTSRLPDSR